MSIEYTYFIYDRISQYFKSDYFSKAVKVRELAQLFTFVSHQTWISCIMRCFEIYDVIVVK